MKSKLTELILGIYFLTPAPKAGVIVVACAVRAAAAAAAAGINLVGVPQTKPMQ